MASKIEFWQCKKCKSITSKRYGDWGTCLRQLKVVAKTITLPFEMNRLSKKPTMGRKPTMKQALRNCSTVLGKCPKCGNKTILIKVKKKK